MSEPEPQEPIDFAQLEEIFGDLFGTSLKRSAPLRRDVRIPFPVTLAEATEGATKELERGRFVACADCDGRGAPEDATFTKCEECEDGSAQTEQRGFFTVRTTCKACAGSGGAWDHVCESCEGTRGESTPKTLLVTIPIGARSGQLLRLAGMGNDLGDGQGHGALLLAITILDDESWTLDGVDLVGTLEITRELADDGGVMDVERFDRTCVVTIPAGSKTGSQVRLRGFGVLREGAPKVPLPDGDQPYRSVDASEHRGDLVVTLVIEGEQLRAAESAEDPFSDPRLIASMAFVAALVLAAMIYGTAVLH